MRKARGLHKELIKEYKELLDSLSKKYNDKKIDINELELKYRELTDSTAEKYGIATCYPHSPEYIKLDEYGKKEIEISIGKKFPRTAIQRIIEEDHGTEPGLKVDENFMSALNKLGYKNDKERKRK